MCDSLNVVCQTPLDWSRCFTHGFERQDMRRRDPFQDR